MSNDKKPEKEKGSTTTGNVSFGVEMGDGSDNDVQIVQGVNVDGVSKITNNYGAQQKEGDELLKVFDDSISQAQESEEWNDDDVRDLQVARMQLEHDITESNYTPPEGLSDDFLAELQTDIPNSDTPEFEEQKEGWFQRLKTKGPLLLKCGLYAGEAALQCFVSKSPLVAASLAICEVLKGD